MPLWNEIEGKTLDGQTLGALLRTQGRTAWFATTADGKPAMLSVFETMNDEDELQARLQAAALVEHPNLQVIYGVGAGSLADEPLVYALLEPFDQTLAEVLRDRTLSTNEAREVSESLLGALEAVERAGLHHGHVDAAGVLAIGDAIKLRSDCLTPGHGESDAPALAALIFQSLTGRRFSSERDFLQLPAPFATVVRAGSGSSGSLAAMRRILSGPVQSGPVASAPAAAAVPSAAKPAPQPNPPARVTPAPAGLSREPVAPAAAAGIPRAALLEKREREPRPRRPFVTIAAVVLMAIALLLFWHAFHQPSGRIPVNGEAVTPAATPQPTPPAASPQSTAAANPTDQAAATMGAPETTRREPKPSAANATPAERSAWHVLAYTYNREEAAQHKATELAAQYPQLEPQVFSPTGHAPYFVALGGAMDRQQAFSRRDAARSAGMPRDTYAQNFRK